MSDLKYEWPYILAITNEERENYQSDLPLEMDTFQVRKLRPTALWQTYDPFDTQVEYVTPEAMRARRETLCRGLVWASLYGFVLSKTVWSTTRWYNTNVVRNFEFFSAETWPAYLRLRFWPIALCSWTAFYMLGGLPFSQYPFPQVFTNWILGEK